MKLLFSAAVTKGWGYKWDRLGGDKLDCIDVRRAFFRSTARRDVHVELPAEMEEISKCGRLEKSMYGTRDASPNWTKAYLEMMENVGLRRGRSTPCAFWQLVRRTRD